MCSLLFAQRREQNFPEVPRFVKLFGVWALVAGRWLERKFSIRDISNTVIGNIWAHCYLTFWKAPVGYRRSRAGSSLQRVCVPHVPSLVVPWLGKKGLEKKLRAVGCFAIVLDTLSIHFLNPRTDFVDRVNQETCEARHVEDICHSHLEFPSIAWTLDHACARLLSRPYISKTEDQQG